MPGRRRVLEPLLLSLLLPLLGALAVLQIGWLRKAASADADRMTASLQRAGKQLVGSISDAMSVLQALFQLDASDIRARRWDGLAAEWSVWSQRSPYPELVRGLVLLTPGSPRGEWFDPARTSFTAVPDADAATVAALRERLFSSGKAALLLDPGSYLDVPAVVIPVFDTGSIRNTKALTEGSFSMASASVSFLVVLLDRSVLSSRVLPSMVEDAFSGDIDRRDYRIVLLDTETGEAVYPPGASAALPSAQARADLVVPIFGGQKSFVLVSKTAPSGTGAAGTVGAAGTETPPSLELRDVLTLMKLRQVTGGTLSLTTTSAAPGSAGALGSAGAPGSVARSGDLLFSAAAVPPSGPAWLLLATHRAGSLDRAVRGIMLRDMTVSLGILVVLGAAVVLLYLSFRRARAASQRQREFVATVSHELRTPLSVIYSAGENLSDGLVTDTARVRGYGEVIREEGRRLRDMVEKVLTLSRGRRTGARGAAAGAEDVDAAELVARAAALQEERCAERGIRLETEVPAEPRVVLRGDREALRAAVQNLVDNAVLHGGSGGLVRITRRTVRGRRGPEVRISVADNGPGIPRRELSRLFEPFRRGEAAVAGQRPGSGLGLAIAWEAARAHRGTVSVESVNGKGSTFTLVLPLGKRS